VHSVGESVAQLGGDAQRQAGFAHPARAGQRKEAHFVAPQQGHGHGHLCLSPEQRGGRCRQEWRRVRTLPGEIESCGDGAGGGAQLSQLLGRQTQRSSQEGHGLQAGRAPASALQIAHRPRGYPRALRQLRLRQPDQRPVAPQQLPELWRSVVWHTLLALDPSARHKSGQCGD
jgi:hypothetical protein